MAVETPSVFARVIQDHLELKRRNAELDSAMPLDGYTVDDPFDNHPLFKTEEQARLEETMDGEPAVQIAAARAPGPARSPARSRTVPRDRGGHRSLEPLARLRLGRLTPPPVCHSAFAERLSRHLVGQPLPVITPLGRPPPRRPSAARPPAACARACGTGRPRSSAAARCRAGRSARARARGSRRRGGRSRAGAR